VLENPVMVDHGGVHHLVMSRGDYGGCGYSTVWRRETSLKRRWQQAEEHVLVDRATSGICGPGGADYVEAVPGRANRLFLHGWVCDGANGPCPTGYSLFTDVAHAGRRAMYVARLRWTRSGPVVAQFAQGPTWTPPPSPVPTPVPTPTPTPTPTPVP
jgi:arabinan endo-1,5-alpha-L-arabinosidase